MEAIHGGKIVPKGETAALINGHPAHLFFDTGVGAPVVLSADYVKKIGLEMAIEAPEHDTDPIPGRPEVGFTVPCQFTFFGVVTDDLPIPVFAMPKNVPRGDEIFEGMGGWPLMRMTPWSFDLAVGEYDQITTIPAAVKKWAQYQIWDADDTLTLVLPSDPRDVERIIVDTGNTSGIELPPDQWKAWRAANPKAPLTIYMDYLPGQKIRCAYESFAKTFPLGSLVLHNVAVSQSDPSYYQVQAEPGEKVVAIGLQALSRMEMYLDPANHAAYVRESRHAALPYLHNRIGAVFFPVDSEQPDSPLVAKVVPATPAALAGIRDGDVLLLVDHYPVAYWREDGTLLRRMGGRDQDHLYAQARRDPVRRQGDGAGYPALAADIAHFDFGAGFARRAQFRPFVAVAIGAAGPDAAHEGFQLGRPGAGPETGQHILARPREETGEEFAVGGQSRPVAVAAERCGDRADEADFTPAVAVPIAGRHFAAIRRPDRFQRPDRGDGVAQLRGGNHGARFPVIGVTHVHELDEAQGVSTSPKILGQRQNLRVVHAALRDAVDLEGKAELSGLVDAAEHALHVESLPVHPAGHGRIERVDGDIEPIQPGLTQGGPELLQEPTVGGQGDVFHAQFGL